MCIKHVNKLGRVRSVAKKSFLAKRNHVLRVHMTQHGQSERASCSMSAASLLP